MRSSTSNSDQRLPGGPWGRAWALAVALVVVTLAGLGATWRAHGHLPEVSDDAALWAMARASVQGDDPNEIVLMGASRMQQDIDLDVFAREFKGRKPVQLAVGGVSFVPVLDDLSRDESFRGIVICDALPTLFYTGGLSPDNGTAAVYLRQYREIAGLSKRISLTMVEQALRSTAQRHLTFRLRALLPTAQNVQLWVERGQLPSPSGRRTYADRSQKSDYRRLDAPTRERLKRLWVHRTEEKGAAVGPDDLNRGLEQVEAMVRRIQARGGRVVIAAFPVSGVVRDAEERVEPRPRYWDVLASHTSAITIHVDDYPELASFECLEGSHLDYRDAAVFTERFARIVRRALTSRER